VYQFASNNPIEGVDLDGLEYLSSKEVRIQIIYGGVELNIANMNSVTRNLIKDYCKDPKNWTSDGGVDITIGSFNFQPINPRQEEDADPNDANPNANPGETKVGKPIAKSTGQEDRRFKDRTVTTASPGGSRALGIVTVGVDLVVKATQYIVQNEIEKDIELVNEHIESFKLAASDVNYALKNTTWISKEYQTEQYISDIVNVVLSGESIVEKWHPEEGKKIKEIGMKIYNTLSIKRKEYTGNIIKKTYIQGVYSISEKNPAYDAQYVKDNPPLSDKPPKQ
jgi:hypothetical protein